jgi:hypothetical protein
MLAYLPPDLPLSVSFKIPAKPVHAPEDPPQDRPNAADFLLPRAAVRDGSFGLIATGPHPADIAALVLLAVSHLGWCFSDGAAVPFSAIPRNDSSAGVTVTSGVALVPDHLTPYVLWLSCAKLQALLLLFGKVVPFICCEYVDPIVDIPPVYVDAKSVFPRSERFYHQWCRARRARFYHHKSIDVAVGRLSAARIWCDA